MHELTQGILARVGSGLNRAETSLLVCIIAEAVFTVVGIACLGL